MTNRSFQPRLETLEGREVPTLMFGLTVSGRLIQFDSARPGNITSTIPITGLLNASSGEVIIDIDMRPGTFGLYGRSNFDQLYLISPLSGFGLPIGTVVPDNSTYHGFDFDPTNNVVRVCGNDGSNFLLNPNDGSLAAVQANLQYRSGDVNAGKLPRVTGLGYTNSVAFATSTVLYGIDHLQNVLVQIGNRTDNAGQLRTVGNLGVNPGARVGFDINPLATIGYAVLQLPGQAYSRFYIINLNSGKATFTGIVGPQRLLYDVAVDIRNVTQPNFAAPEANNTITSTAFTTGAVPVGTTNTGLFPTSV